MCGLPPAAATSLPLEIDAMRARQYPGSDIVIERVLDPGVNYSRYYVSYLSEGLKIYALMTVPNWTKATDRLACRHFQSWLYSA